MPKPVAAAAPPRTFVLRLPAWYFAALLAAVPPAMGAGSDSATQEGHGHGSESPAEVRLTPEQRRTLGLTLGYPHAFLFQNNKLW